jgi:hypothetical protein
VYNAEIDTFGGDRDSEPREKRARDPEQCAAPQKAAHHRCGGQGRKTDSDQRQVIVGTVADDPRQLHQPRNNAGQYPGSHAELEFPRHQPAAEDEAMGRLGGLENLVRPYRAGLYQDGLEPQQNRQRHQSRQPDFG